MSKGIRVWVPVDAAGSPILRSISKRRPFDATPLFRGAVAIERYLLVPDPEKPKKRTKRRPA